MALADRARVMERNMYKALSPATATAIIETAFGRRGSVADHSVPHVPCEESVTALLLELFARTGEKQSCRAYRLYCRTSKTARDQAGTEMTSS
jgi:hypothetical protein